MTDKFTLLDQEVIILGTVWNMIDDMVNFGVFEKLSRHTDTQLNFQSSVHAKMFNVLLGDFLSQLQARRKDPLPFGLPPAPSGARQSDLTHLFYLRRVCASPQFSSDPSRLLKAVDSFGTWLEGETYIEKVWLPSINTELNIAVQRIEFLRICGDIAKHNISRLQGTVRRICSILDRNGHPISEADGFLVLEEFFEWFHTHLFMYHASTIGEFLNNIRWEMYRYLLTEFRRAYRKLPDPLLYTYSQPAGLSEGLAKGMYWHVMNQSRSPPYFPEFTVAPSLKAEF